MTTEGVRVEGTEPWLFDGSYPRALMVTHQGCPQMPGGRIRVPLKSHGGFASTRTRGRRRGPIPAMCQCQGSPVSFE